MSGHATTTPFVTEGAGFIGAELVKVLVARGLRVVGLVPSIEAAEREKGDVGERYFLVDEGPVRSSEFAATVARLANRPMRVLQMPAVVTRLVVGPILHRQLVADAVSRTSDCAGWASRSGTPRSSRGSWRSWNRSMNDDLSSVVDQPLTREEFGDVVLPHLDAAHRLARWLVRNDDDAADVVQDASLRALRYFHTFTGGNGRAWFLSIVRNSCRDWSTRRGRAVSDPFDESEHSGLTHMPDPETLMLRRDSVALITRTLDDLPERPRALLKHRELEGLSYNELAATMGIPLGTVMSGLSRARQAFRGALDKRLTPPQASALEDRSPGRPARRPPDRYRPAVAARIRPRCGAVTGPGAADPC
jgi:RNA polymerase sigma-70 factor (ECF subfamily)